MAGHQLRWKKWVVTGAVVAAAVVLAQVVAPGASSVPNPTVTGPIPATAAPGDPSHNYPFFATNVDLASYGYTEEEFFLDGTANTYNVTPGKPKADTAEITSSGHPYRTRMLVRRPLSEDDFNGTVIMEWLNVTAGYDLDALWIASHDHLIRRGYAWIGVSAQRTGVLTLRGWSKNRYGSLNVGTDDSYSWDIFSQAAQAVRQPMGVDPMGGLTVERVFAAGWSQSAIRLTNYHNSIHPLALEVDAIALIGLDGKELLPLRTDLDVKVFKVLFETNVAGNAIAISQALLRPQEPNTSNFRRWEVAGAAHLGYYEVEQALPLLARDLSSTLVITCDVPPLSRIPARYVVNAAYDHMVKWVKHEVEPPIGDDIEIASCDSQTCAVARDGFGNALGGIRLAQHAVPTATNTGLNTPVTNSSFCRYVGSYEAFDAATLAALYPTHQRYLGLVIEATHESQKDGFIVGPDAAATISEAAQSGIGRK